MSSIQINDVVLFTDKHKYRGCFGVVKKMETVKRVKYYEVVVPIPDCGSERAVATIDDIEKVGKVNADEQ